MYEAQQKQIKAMTAAVNKKSKCVILKQVNVIPLLLLQMLAAIENYQYYRSVRIIYKSKIN